MIVLRDGDPRVDSSASSVVAIGVFDGLHRGHQAIIAEVIDRARHDDALATVVTFDPSPAMVLAPTRAPRLLMTVDQRIEGLLALGVDQVRIITFDATIERESARHFVERVLVEELRARCVVVGEDFHFGHNREGNVALLREVGAHVGFDVVAAPLYGEGERWSSTAVRRDLASGDLAAADDVLGHVFELRGRVVHGDARGDALGFRTANLALSPEQLLPEEGVYAGATCVEGVWWPGAVSVGTRPQFYDDGEVLVEVHLPGFDGDLYGVELTVAFLARLRAQTTFATLDELTERIAVDVEETLRIFGDFSPEEAKLLR